MDRYSFMILLFIVAAYPPDSQMSRLPRCSAIAADAQLGRKETAGPAAAKVLPIQPGENAWQSLFNGRDLTGWKPLLKSRHTEPGVLTDTAIDRIIGVENGEIHFYGTSPAEATVPEGFLASDSVYGDYALRLEFKWGKKKFAQRAKKKRNSGLMFHAQDTVGFWPTSVECQIMEGDVGDIYTQNHAWVTTTIDTVVEDPQSKKPFPHYAKGGRVYDHGGRGSSRLMHEARQDRSEGWNRVEIEVRGDRATFRVNGQVTARMWNIRYIDPSQPDRVTPLLQGRILLQAEATEIYFRNIYIKKL